MKIRIREFSARGDRHTQIEADAVFISSQGGGGTFDIRVEESNGTEFPCQMPLGGHIEIQAA